MVNKMLVLVKRWHSVKHGGPAFVTWNLNLLSTITKDPYQIARASSYHLVELNDSKILSLFLQADGNQPTDVAFCISTTTKSDFFKTSNTISKQNELHARLLTCLLLYIVSAFLIFHVTFVLIFCMLIWQGNGQKMKWGPVSKRLYITIYEELSDSNDIKLV